VKRWLKAHPRFHLHFTPTSSSWLNMVGCGATIKVRDSVNQDENAPGVS
jgi:hypothetical protein